MPKFSKENPPKNTDFVKTSQKGVDPCYLTWFSPVFTQKNQDSGPQKTRIWQAQNSKEMAPNSKDPNIDLRLYPIYKFGGQPPCQLKCVEFR